MVDRKKVTPEQSKTSSAPQDITHESSVSFDVYRKLRADIMACKLKPNQRLRSDALKSEYGAAVGTLREALSHLVSDGLVRTEFGKGYSVSPVSVEDLLDITEWRVEFEVRAIIDSIRNGGDLWEAELVTAYHLFTKAGLPDNEAAAEEWLIYTEKHQRFHNAIVASCGSPWLLYFRNTLIAQGQRYQALAYLCSEPSVYRGDEDHKGIMDAVMARDEKLAAELIELHIRRTTEIVVEALSRSDVNDKNSGVVSQKVTTAPQDIAHESSVGFDVYRKIRLDITTCKLKPNQRLRSDTLKIEYGAAIGAIREALSHLVADGLVRTEFGRGFSVAPVSVEDLTEIARWRVEFEVRAITDSITKGDDHWEAEVVTAYHLFAKAGLPEYGAPVEQWVIYAEKHQRFHDALVAGCGSPWLLHFRGALIAQAHRYQDLAFNHPGSSAYRGDEDHQKIMDAVIARDEKLAAELIEAHICRTADIVTEELSLSGALEGEALP